MKHPLRKPTEEERKEDVAKILEMFQVGIPIARMEIILDYSPNYIKTIRDELIENGLITQEEIKEKADQYFKEHPKSRGLDGTRMKQKPEKKPRANVEAVNKNKDTITQKIKEGKTINQIAFEMEMAAATIYVYIKELEEEGRIKREDIKKANEGRQNITIDKKSEEYLSKRQSVVEALRKGWSNFAIRITFNITSYEMDILMKDIKYRKLITSEEIKIARAEKEKEDSRDLAEYINQGYTIDEIQKKRKDFTESYINSMKKKLIEQGVIRKEQIKENIQRSRQEKFNKAANAGKTFEEQYEIVTEKVKLGYSPKEIFESSPSTFGSLSRVKYLKKQIIQKGIIFSEEAEALMKQRTKVLVDDKKDKSIETIKEYIEKGYPITEIAIILGRGHDYITDAIDAYEKEHGWYTKKQLREFRRKRFKRDINEMPEELAEIHRQRAKNDKKRRKQKNKEYKKFNEQRMQLIKEYIVQGLVFSEIAEKVGCGKTRVGTLIKEYKEEGNQWFSDEEIAEFREKRRQKELEDPQKMQEYLDEIKRRQEEKEAKIRQENEERQRRKEQREIEDKQCLEDEIKQFVRTY